MIGDLKGKNQISAYQPTQEVLDITKMVKEDYITGADIIQRGSFPRFIPNLLGNL